MNTKDDPKKLVGEMQMLRIRVATAESEVKLLHYQAQQAKRRHKEAKRIAERARKQFKWSKSELAELQQTLAKAEVKLFQAGACTLASDRLRHEGVEEKLGGINRFTSVADAVDNFQKTG